MWILEDPLPTIGALAAALVACGYWLYAGGDRWAIATAVVAGLLGGGLLVMEQLVETDREKIEAILFASAAAVERNDFEGVSRYVSDAAPEARSQLRWVFDKVDFERVTIKNNLDITVRDDLDPPLAVATFNVVVTGKLGSGAAVQAPRSVELRWRKENQQWRVSAFRHQAPVGPQAIRPDSPR